MTQHNMTHRIRVSSVVAVTICGALLTAACGKDTGSTGKDTPVATEQKPAADQAGTGRTIVVELYSDATGNYFKPNDIEAKRGDIIRFTDKVGVHNINFLPDSNAGKSGLPPASDMLQVPDQTYDLKVSLGNGRYYFQCDLHALLGMKGHLTIKD